MQQQSTDDLFQRAVDLQRAGHPDQVVALLSPAYEEVDEQDVRLTVQLAEARRRLGESPEAAALYEAAAVFYAGEGLLAHAVALAQVVSSLQPSGASLLPRLAAAYAQAPMGLDGGPPFGDVFQALDEGALEVLFSTGEIRRYKRGEVIADGTRGGGGLFVLLKGEARIFGRDASNGWKEVIRFRAGQVVDADSLRWGVLVGRYVAAFDCTFIEVPQATVAAALQRNEAFAAALNRWRRGLSLSQVLAGRPAFMALDQLSRRLLSLSFEEVTVQAGEVIFAEGVLGDHLYMAHSGVVHLTTDGPDGPIVVGEMQPGGVFGAETVLGDMPNLTSARAHTDAVLVRVARDRIERAYMHQPEALEFLKAGIRKQAMEALQRMS